MSLVFHNCSPFQCACHGTAGVFGDLEMVEESFLKNMVLEEASACRAGVFFIAFLRGISINNEDRAMIRRLSFVGYFLDLVRIVHFKIKINNVIKFVAAGFQRFLCA